MLPSMPPRIDRIVLGLPFLVLLGVACSESTPASLPAPTVASASTESKAPEEPALSEEAQMRKDFAKVMSPPELESCFGKRGLSVQKPGATPGYTLVMPLNSKQVHLVDLAGAVAHTWETGFAPGGWCYLLDDGSLLYAGRVDHDAKFRGGGIGGAIRRFAPDGTVLWRFDFAEESRWQHHDLEPLPNGNLLFIAWERKSRDEAIARGRHPDGVGEVGLWPDAVYEVRPTLPEGGDIVWEWHAWDHLVQDVDAAKPNHGKLVDHRGRLDVNAAFEPESKQTDEEKQRIEDRAKQMAALGYGGSDAQDPPVADAPDSKDADEKPRGKEWNKTGDWMHTNAVDYHHELDLIVLSSPELCEIFVIDHSTTTAEATGSTGGRFGKGGDLLWRYGNPENYGAGTSADRRLFYQHDPNWLFGVKGEARLIVFNNGGDRPGGDRSSVDELVLPFDAARGVLAEPGQPYGPESLAWTYESKDTFYSAFISGARRLASGNTIIASGAAGRIFEVTRAGEIVWDYANPLGGDVKPPDHAGKAPRLALFRADRYAPEHPGIRRVIAN